MVLITWPFYLVSLKYFTIIFIIYIFFYLLSFYIIIYK